MKKISEIKEKGEKDLEKVQPNVMKFLYNRRGTAFTVKEIAKGLDEREDTVRKVLSRSWRKNHLIRRKIRTDESKRKVFHYAWNIDELDKNPLEIGYEVKEKELKEEPINPLSDD